MYSLSLIKAIDLSYLHISNNLNRNPCSFMKLMITEHLIIAQNITEVAMHEISLNRDMWLSVLTRILSPFTNYYNYPF